MRKRLFCIMQFEKNPITGEDLNFNEAIIKKALEHKVIKKWAYIKHDKDVYSEADEKYDCERLKLEYSNLSSEIKNQYENEEDYIEKKLVKRKGEKKPIHYHIVFFCDTAIELNDIARYFNVSPNYVEIPKGRGQKAFYDCIEYLTHEHPNQQALNKYLYPDEEVISNFDWRTELTTYQARRLEHKGKYTDDKSYCEYQVAYEGMTLKHVYKNYPDVWLLKNEINILTKLRNMYLSQQPAPINRINFYICGKGGQGKGLLSEAIARTMFPDLDDDELFFRVGSKNVTFEGYDGQPVIIWDDFRSIEFMGTANNRGHIFRLLEPNPKSARENVKNSSLQLLNRVNIINSVQPYKEFLDNLAGEYTDKYGEFHKAEDKTQVFRRFPIIIPINENDFDILANRGFMLGTPDWDQYNFYKRVSFNMREAIINTNYDKSLEIETSREMLKPVQEDFQGFLKKAEEHTEDEKKAYLEKVRQSVKVYGPEDLSYEEIHKYDEDWMTEKEKEELEIKRQQAKKEVVDETIEEKCNSMVNNLQSSRCYYAENKNELKNKFEEYNETVDYICELTLELDKVQSILHRGYGDYIKEAYTYLINLKEKDDKFMEWFKDAANLRLAFE